MKIISLNTWGGRAGRDKLLDFFEQHKGSTDVFCLQEIWSAPYEHLDGVSAGGRPIDHRTIMTSGYQDISSALPDFEPLFHPHYGDNYGLMMLVKKELEIKNSGEVFVYRHKGFEPPLSDIGRHARNIQYATVSTKDGDVTIVNFHGLWNGKGKGDSEERIEQSDKILEFLKALNNPFVLCGDFNLTPETESLKKFEESGLKNMIKEYGVTSTRTSYYDKDERFADYIFTSPELKEASFEVLPDEVSDHAPLLIEIE